MRAEIYRRLGDAKIPRERFDYRGNVPSFWEASTEHDIDVCIGSFPLGSGLTVEAMGSGTPYVVHGNYVRVLCEIDQIYPEGFGICQQGQDAPRADLRFRSSCCSRRLPRRRCRGPGRRRCR
jgi:hypothetical protein